MQRPMTVADAARLADVRNAAEAVDALGEHHAPEDCLEELTDPERDLERDTLIVLDGDLPVATQVLYVIGSRLFAAAEVRPSHRGRGLGTMLLELAVAEAGRRGLRAEMQFPERRADATALAVAAGFVPIRWWSEMRRDMPAAGGPPVEPVPLPDGLVAHPLGPAYDHERWDGLLRAAHNAAFAEHFGFSPVGAQAWRHNRTGSKHFRPEHSVVALDGDAVAGYVLASEYEADTAATGMRDLYIPTVGTLPQYRGRGLASALLAHVLGTAGAYGRASLTVDSQNPTGALGVYARAGFALHRRDVTYAAPV